jgi:hypothetical protein
MAMHNHLRLCAREWASLGRREPAPKPKARATMPDYDGDDLAALARALDDREGILR